MPSTGILCWRFLYQVLIYHPSNSKEDLQNEGAKVSASDVFSALMLVTQAIYLDKIDTTTRQQPKSAWVWARPYHPHWASPSYRRSPQLPETAQRSTPVSHSRYRTPPGIPLHFPAYRLPASPVIPCPLSTRPSSPAQELPASAPEQREAEPPPVSCCTPAVPGRWGRMGTAEPGSTLGWAVRSSVSAPASGTHRRRTHLRLNCHRFCWRDGTPPAAAAAAAVPRSGDGSTPGSGHRSGGPKQ
ncbi:hypothetical protein Cgig2_014683 [Carnegiea gigantea]|uniref:Uncharacterized protein n=1 Tax=Carnegiea gigantea TaxID=171969 RepID=A0A9Q1L1G7_9CARY|nr:hypothetical protein Cgig2_014683 [Carnegiea gigantea]